MSEEIEQLKQTLSKPNKIAVIIHRNPDGDAMGAGLALKEYLSKKGHQVELISPNEVPDYLRWLPDAEKTLVFDRDRKTVKQKISEADLLFTLDFNDFSRTGSQMEELLEKYIDKPYVMIDHHLEPKAYAKYKFSDPTKSSTSEMIYEFIVNLGGKQMIDKHMATNLYTGIMTDTGSFKFPNTTANTHLIVADLMKTGIDTNKIQIRIYDSFDSDKLHLLGLALNKLIFMPKYKTAYIVLSKEELNRFNYRKGDTEGFVNYGLALEDSNFAALFSENDDEGVRISFRSKGKFPANEFAKKYFNGGGHLNAAGGRTKQSLNDAVQLFLDKLPEFKDKLLNANE